MVANEESRLKLYKLVATWSKCITVLRVDHVEKLWYFSGISDQRSALFQKHLESFEMWCWRRMEKISWTDHVRNEDVLLRVKEQRNILHEISKRKANWIGHILRRNCLLQQVIEGKIKVGI